MARQIDLDQLMKYPLRRGSEHCDEKNADPRFLNGVESILEWAQTLPTLTPPNEWVSVEDELPARDGIYLVYTTRGSVTTAHFYAEKIFRDDYKRKASWQGNRNVTHWMPLPAPPGKDNNVPTKAQNEPLTIEQLREMDGEPVYIVFSPDVDGEKLQFWALVAVDEWDDVYLANKDEWAFNYEEFLEDVEAIYRRPPEGAGNA